MPPCALPSPTVKTRTPRSAAIFAASSGSGPVVLRPSLSRMIAAEAYEPGGTGMKSFCSAFFGWSIATPRVVVASARAEDHRLEIDARVREDRRERHDEAAADRGVALQLEPVDRGDEVFAVLRRRLHEQRGACERHDADAHVGRLLLDERLGRFLRGGEAVRLDVGRAHAERHVDREDDRALLGRQRDDRGRARDREQHRGDDREEEEQRRQVAAQRAGRGPSASLTRSRLA